MWPDEAAGSKCIAAIGCLAALYHAGQSAVVDNLAPDGLDSTRARQRFWANQDAAASGASHFAPRIPNPLRRIQCEEKEDERRNQQLLREAGAVQLHHERRQIVAARFSHGN